MPSIVHRRLLPSHKRSMYSCKCTDLDKCIRGYRHSPPVLDTTLALSFLVTPKLLNTLDGRHMAVMKKLPGVLNRCHLFLFGARRVLQCVPGAVRREAGILGQVTRPTVHLTLSVFNEYLCIYSICAA